METYFLGAYWFDRKESIEQCTERVLRCLGEFGNSDVACSRWFREGRSRKQALVREVPLTSKGIRELLLEGRNKRDVGGEVIEELGFSMSLWNGDKDDQGVGFRVHCGAYAGNPNLRNSCVLDLPSQGPPSERLLQAETLVRLMQTVVESFDPDWAVVMPRALLKSIQFVPSKPMPGWLFYSSDRVLRLPRLSTTTRVVSLPSHGTIAIVTEERFSTQQPEHLQARDAVQAAVTSATGN